MPERLTDQERRWLCELIYRWFQGGAVGYDPFREDAMRVLLRKLEGVDKVVTVDTARA